jgi:hypothetical protein
VAAVLGACLSAGATEALGQEPDPVADAGCTRIADYDASLFSSSSHRVTNRYLPLAPGSQRVFEGRSNTTGTVLPHRVTFTVTGLTKVVDGVRTAVVWDVDENDGQVAEAELALFAQDRAGRVWNLGEYPEEYPEGVFRGAPSTWFAGIEDAEPGVHMPAVPRLGRPEYLQGSVPSIEFLDCAQVVDTEASACVPVKCFDHVVVTHERSPLDPSGGIQVKSHAPGVGIFQIGALDDPEAETLVLTEFRMLGARRLREANREARTLDQRGLQCSDVYAQTTPLEGPDDGDFGPFTCGVPEPVEPPPLVTGATAPAFPVAPTTPGAAAAPRHPNPVRGRFYAWVDHPFVPLLRVQTTVHEGVRRGVTRRVETRVRDTRVRVDGVLATAVDVTVRDDGKVVERATRYLAQQRNGSVWSLGERIRQVRRGRVIGHAGGWIAGRSGARRGLFMPAVPAIGRRFRQTRAPGVARERATVVSLDTSIATRAGRFTGCLQTRVTGRRRRAVRESRVYCRGVGLVREQAADRFLELVGTG